MNKKGEKNVRFNEKKHIFAPKTIKNAFFSTQNRINFVLPND